MYGKYLVMGTQTNKDGVALINSQMKHWTTYGVENGRMGFNGNISVHDMSETYMVPLKIMLDANVSSAMCVRPFYHKETSRPCLNDNISRRVPQ